MPMFLPVLQYNIHKLEHLNKKPPDIVKPVKTRREQG